jgi:hypothetical protein
VFGAAKTDRVGLVALIEGLSCDVGREAGAGTWGITERGR